MIRITVLTDGSSDRALLPIIRWTLIQAGIAPDLQLEWADLRSLRNPPVGLTQRIDMAISLYPCDVLFVHRDAERESAATRHAEIREALQRLGSQLLHVCVVPVRMLEAWLLCDELAIRKASGNPGGRSQINLPRTGRTEGLADPKSALVEALRNASELSGRRLKSFDALRARTLVAQYIEDFSLLRHLSSFQAFETDVATLVHENHFDSYR